MHTILKLTHFHDSVLEEASLNMCCMRTPLSAPDPHQPCLKKLPFKQRQLLQSAAKLSMGVLHTRPTLWNLGPRAPGQHRFFQRIVIVIKLLLLHYLLLHALWHAIAMSLACTWQKVSFCSISIPGAAF